MGDRHPHRQLRLAQPRLLRTVVERLGACATLHIVPAGDHSFHIPKSAGGSGEVLSIALTIACWIKARAGSAPAPHLQDGAVEEVEPEVVQTEVFEPETFEPEVFQPDAPAGEEEEARRGRFPRWVVTAIWISGLAVWILVNALADRG